ncbi:hypothetical protein ABPG74_014213 [Tetrahymena malaccensis]
MKLIITIFFTLRINAFDIVDSSCLVFPFCQICSANSCLICQEGYQLSYDNLCLLNTNNQSKYPKIGFYFDSLSQQLQLCHPSCQMCRGPYNYQCLGCALGYQEIISYSDMFYCIKCEVSNCNRCDSDGKCLECISQFYLDQNSNSCTQCQIQNCQICSSAAVCGQCAKGYILTNYGSQCKIEGVNAVCQIQRCKSCSKQGECNLCQDGFFLQNGQCTQCQSPCLTCQDESTSCTSCQRDQFKDFYLQGTQCVVSCNHQFYASKSLGKCVECSSSIDGCLTCLDQYTCTSCIDQVNYTIQNNKCVRKCKPNQFIPMNNLQQIKSLQQRRLWELDQDSIINSCQNCSPEINSICKQCVGLSTYCEVCQDDYFLYNGKCLASCPPSTYSLIKSKQKKCFDCMEGCKQCINGYTCIQCDDSFQMSSNKQCMIKDQYIMSNQPVKCPQNYVFFNGFCMPSCPSGTITFQNKCQANDSCEIISFDISQQIASCQKCKDSSKFIYQGYCLPQCPMFSKTISANGICLPQCDSNSFTLLQDFKFPQCVKECPLLSILTGYQEVNQYCIQTVCKQGEYFDTIAYFNSEIQDQQMCKQCHSSCLSCNGPTQYDCIECKIGLVYQEHYLDNDLNPLLIQNSVSFSNSTINAKASFHLCQNNCNQGYQKSFYGVCTKCQDLVQCLNCPSFSYINGNQCQDTCMSDLSLIEKINKSYFKNNFCVQRSGLILQVNCSKKIDNICLSTNFLSVQAIAQIPSFNNQLSSLVCNTSQKLQLTVQFDNNLNMYNITGFNAQTQKFSIYCSLKDQNKLLYGASTKTIKLLGNFTGDFYLSTDKAISQYDQINFNLSNFRIPSLLNNQLNYSVYVSTKYIDIYGKEQILDIFQANQYMNSNFLPKYRNQNVSISSNFSIPLLNFNQQLQIKAEVFSIYQGERINVINSKYITVYSNTQSIYNTSKIIVQYNRQETIKQLISYILSNYTEFNLNDFFVLYQINDILSYNSNQVSSDTEVQRDVNIVKSQNYGFNQQFIACDRNITCNNQGKCGYNRNYYLMCECFDNYLGEGCSWQDNQLFASAQQFIEKLTLNLLEAQQSQKGDTMLELKYSILLRLMKSRQIFTQTSFQNIYTMLYQLDNDKLSQLSLSCIQNILEIYSYFIDLARLLNMVKQVRGNIVNLIERTVIIYFRKVQGNLTFESSNLFIQFYYIYNTKKDLMITFTENTKFIMKFKKRQLQQNKQLQFNKYFLVSFNLPSDIFITDQIESSFTNSSNVIVSLSPVTTSRLLYVDQSGMVSQEQNLFFSLDASLKGPQGKANQYTPECYIFTNNLTQLDKGSNLNFERINTFSQLQCENIGLSSTFIGIELSQDYINSIDSSQDINKNEIQQAQSDDGVSFYWLKVGLITSFITISHLMLFFTKYFCKGKTFVSSQIFTRQSEQTAVPNQSSSQSEINAQKQEIQLKNQLQSMNIKEQNNQISITGNNKDQLSLNQNKIQNKFTKRKESQRIMAGIKMDSSQDFKQQQEQDQQQQLQKKERSIPIIQEVCLQPQIISQLHEQPIQINNQNIKSLSNCSMNPDSIQIVFQNTYIQENQNKNTIKQNNTSSIIQNNNEQLQQVNQNSSSKQESIIKINENQVYNKIFYYHSFTCFFVSFEYCPNYMRVMYLALNYYLIASSNLLILSLMQDQDLGQIDQIIISVFLGIALTYFISFLVLLILKTVFRCLKNDNKLSNFQLILFYLVFAIVFTAGSVIISFSTQEYSSYSILSYFISTLVSIFLTIILETILLLYLKYNKSKRILQLIQYRSLDFQKRIDQ